MKTFFGGSAKNCKLWSTIKKIIGLDVDLRFLHSQILVDSARSVYANAFEFGHVTLLHGQFHPLNFSRNRT